MHQKRVQDDDLVPDEELRARLYEKRSIDAIGDCWNWMGGKTGGGYGELYVRGEPRYVHRLSAAVHLGFDLASSRCVLHRCDNRACFNPEHLRIGTQQDNIRDAVDKGRLRQTRNRLVPDEVREIRRLIAEGQNYPTIAKQFGVTRLTILRIANGHTWKTIEASPGSA